VICLCLGPWEGEVKSALEHNDERKEVLAVDFLQLHQFQSGQLPSLHPFLAVQLQMKLLLLLYQEVEAEKA
jgi:hypothetical protein